ncbi:MAG: alpha-galactosidase, partial [Rhizobiales bacterium]|nr:alpha-galactosidase [Hyphomicrobiales bacterium]
QQKALNMALPEVRDFIYDRMAAILSAHEIDYVKWDHNRVLPMPDADQTRGSYALIDRLRAEFPKVEIESCASGGGADRFRDHEANAAGLAERQQRCAGASSDPARRGAVSADGRHRLPCGAAALPHLGAGSGYRLPGLGRGTAAYGLRDGSA